MAESKKKKGLLPRIEMTIIGIFFISFVFFMIPKCGSNVENEKQAMETELTASTPEPVKDTLATPAFAPAKIQKERTSLYSTINGLNMREEPHLASPILKRLALHEEVYYLNELTEKRQTIDWGDGLVTEEPWLKVQTDDGRIGWVYGAGLHFYKKVFPMPKEEAEGEEE